MLQASAARPPLVRNENVKAEIRRSLTQSASAFNRGDVDTILAAYAPDAVVLPPNSPAVQGIHAIRQLWESLLAVGYRNAAFELDEIEHWGEVALAIGRYNVQVPITGWPISCHCEHVVQRPLAPRDFADGDREAVAVVVGNDLLRIGRNVQNLANCRNLGN
jgi:ketosteroid isomerase-like protein